MRLLLPVTALALAQVGAAWAVRDVNVARPGGAFSTVEVENAASCERVCADDTLCMAWSYRDNLCELKAIVPAAIVQDGTISGVSARAPLSLRDRSVRTEMAPDAPPEIPSATDPALTQPEDDVAVMLLGGLEHEEKLRTRLGN
ncbi:MAG: PAN domain-containing protein [Caulobacteraceae bacterium]